MLCDVTLIDRWPWCSDLELEWLFLLYFRLYPRYCKVYEVATCWEHKLGVVGVLCDDVAWIWALTLPW